MDKKKLIVQTWLRTFARRCCSRNNSRAYRLHRYVAIPHDHLDARTRTRGRCYENVVYDPRVNFNFHERPCIVIRRSSDEG